MVYKHLRVTYEYFNVSWSSLTLGRYFLSSLFNLGPRNLHGGKQYPFPDLYARSMQVPGERTHVQTANKTSIYFTLTIGANQHTKSHSLFISDTVVPTILLRAQFKNKPSKAESKIPPDIV